MNDSTRFGVKMAEVKAFHFLSDRLLEVRDTCAREKETRTTLEDAQADQTSLALPTSIPVPPLTQAQLPEPDAAKEIRMTQSNDPAVTSDPSYLPNAGGPQFYDYASSTWEAGSVPSDANYGEWDPLWVTTHAGNGAVFHIKSSTDTYTVNTNPTLETSVLETTDYELSMFTHTWTCPKAVGDLYITNIVQSSSQGIGADGSNFAGLNYIVYFKTKGNQTGHFDMVSQTWVFDNP
jgi:hypothetical protein